MHKKKIITALVSVLLVALVCFGLFMALKTGTTAGEISKENAESFVNQSLDSIAVSAPMKSIAEKNSITVNSVSYGEEKDIILDCTFHTPDMHSAVSPAYDTFMASDEKKKNGTMFKSALDFKMEFEPMLTALLENAEMKTADGTLYLYDTRDGLVLYASDEAVNLAYGGMVEIRKDIDEKKTVLVTHENGETEEKELSSANIKKGFLQCFEVRQNDKPDTATPLGVFWNKLKKDFYESFIEANRWQTILTGLWSTVKLTIFALILGIIIGFIVAFVRSTYLKHTRRSILLKFANAICQVYLTVIRGTPVVVQIMIIYFVIFMPMGVDKFLSAVVCFGLNSGAYVAEIVRGGIMSVDEGQTEAGRSLGFGYMATMFYIILPQAFKAVLPALANEFVVLLKETSIAFYIGLGDLMYSINAIRAATYKPFMPLIASAVIYLIMVLILQHLVTLLERRLRNSER